MRRACSARTSSATLVISVALVGACASSVVSPEGGESEGATATTGQGGSASGSITSSAGGAPEGASVGGGAAGGAPDTAASTSTTATSSATSGAGPAEPECVDASDCKLHNDCCGCVAMPTSEAAPPCDKPTCFVDGCTSLGLTPVAATCEAGHCAAFDCDHSKVMCKMAEPSCPPGETPSVVNQCWAGCVPAGQCVTVGSCAQCDAKTQTCVTDSTKAGLRLHCADIPPSCGGKPTCACMGAAVCVGVFDVCNDAAEGILCGCSAC